MKIKTWINAEAIQFNGSNYNELNELSKGSMWQINKDEYENLWLELEGEMLNYINLTDWLIKYENGCVRVIDNDTFQKEF